MSLDLWNALHPQTLQVQSAETQPCRTGNPNAPHPSPMKGVYWETRGKRWWAAIVKKARRYTAGPFHHADQAVEALAKIKQELGNKP